MTMVLSTRLIYLTGNERQVLGLCDIIYADLGFPPFFSSFFLLPFPLPVPPSLFPLLPSSSWPIVASKLGLPQLLSEGDANGGGEILLES